MIQEQPEDFGLLQAFYIDNGELNGLTPQLVFVLGFEYAQMYQQLLSGEPFEMQFHSDNEHRFRKTCESHEADFTVHIHDDWPVLVVRGVTAV